MKIPRIEFSLMSEEEKSRFTQFENMEGIAIPSGIGFAVAYDSQMGHYRGVVISYDSEDKYARSDKETILLRTCETFLGARPVRSESDTVVR